MYSRVIIGAKAIPLSDALEKKHERDANLEKDAYVKIKRLKDRKGTLVNTKTNELLGSTGYGKTEVPTPATLDKLAEHTNSKAESSLSPIVDPKIVEKVKGVDPLYPSLTGVAHKFTPKPLTQSEEIKNRVNARVESAKVLFRVVQGEALADPASIDRYFCSSCWNDFEASEFKDALPPCETCKLEYGIRLKGAEDKLNQALAFQEILNLKKSEILPGESMEHYGTQTAESEDGSWVYADEIESILDKYIK